MRKNLTFFLIGSLLFLLFVLFSYLVHKDFLTQFDFDTTVRLQNNISRRFDEIFSYFSVIGSFEPMAIFLMVILVLWRKIITGISLLIGFIGFHLFELFGKFFVDHLPPPEFMLRTKRLVEFPQFHVRSEFSYPSGHAGRAVFIACVLLFIIWHSKRFSKELKIIFTGVIVLYGGVMLISRIYLGEHWTSDVIGGSILALGLSFIGFSIYRKSSSRTKKSVEHSVLPH